MSRLRSGSLSIRPKPVDLAALTRRVVESLVNQAEAAGSTFDVEAPQTIDGVWDEFRIEQVLTNLITNALRYGRGSPVAVAVTRSGDHAVMTVRDQGIGIAPEDHGRIFEQFERTDDSRKHAAGLGLGLYITREIVHAHGGEIMLESAPGEGALFRVTLPLHAPPDDA